LLVADLPRSVDRRSFLLALPALLGGAGLFLCCDRAGDPQAALDLLVADLEPRGDSGMLAERSLAELTAGTERSSEQALGSIRTAPATRERLARELLPGADWRGGPAAVRRSLDMRVRSDYEAGRTVQTGGWILSQTEVRLLAYRALADRAN
jgi:hypothetical protein